MDSYRPIYYTYIHILTFFIQKYCTYEFHQTPFLFSEQHFSQNFYIIPKWFEIVLYIIFYISLQLGKFH